MGLKRKGEISSGKKGENKEIRLGEERLWETGGILEGVWRESALTVVVAAQWHIDVGPGQVL